MGVKRKVAFLIIAVVAVGFFFLVPVVPVDMANCHDLVITHHTVSISFYLFRIGGSFDESGRYQWLTPGCLTIN